MRIRDRSITRILCSMTRRHAKLGVRAAETVDKTVDERRVDARRRLVQQQELRLVHQRHREFKELLLPEAEASRLVTALLVETDETEKIARMGIRRRRHRAEKRQQAPLRLARTDRHIFRAGHVVIDACLLIGAEQPAARDGRGAEMPDGAALEQDVAAIDGMGARNAAEQSRLAGAVRPDQPRDLTLPDRERDTLIRNDAADAWSHSARREARS